MPTSLKKHLADPLFWLGVLVGMIINAGFYIVFLA